MATRKPIKSVEAKAPAAKAPAKEVLTKEKVTRNKQVKAMDFVGVWQKSESAEDVAEHFERDSNWASSFASRLRKMGVHLKKMTRGVGGGGGRLDIDELNSLIDED